MVIAIYVDWMVWWIQCCRPFLWPLIAFVPSIPQKRIKVLSRPFDASNLITTSFKSVAFLDAGSRTIPRKHSMGVWVCASNFIFLWQFFFLNFLFFLLIQYVCYFFQKKKQISVLIMVLWEGFSLLVSCIRVLLTGFTKPAYFLWAIAGPGKLLFPFNSEKQAFLSSTIKERF